MSAHCSLFIWERSVHLTMSTESCTMTHQCSSSHSTPCGTHQVIPLLCAFQTRRVFESGVLCCGTRRPSREAEQGLLYKREAVGGLLAGQPVCLDWELSHGASVQSKEFAETGWAGQASHTTWWGNQRSTDITDQKTFNFHYVLVLAVVSTFFGSLKSDLKHVPEVLADS